LHSSPFPESGEFLGHQDVHGGLAREAEREPLAAHQGAGGQSAKAQGAKGRGKRGKNDVI